MSNYTEQIRRNKTKYYEKIVKPKRLISKELNNMLKEISADELLSLTGYYDDTSELNTRMRIQ